MGQSKSGIVGGCLFTQGLDTCVCSRLNHISFLGHELII